VKLKREVAALERAVFVKEKEHEQDSVVKIQLGKRLEQVLLDKEEAYEELEQLQVLDLSSIYPIYFSSATRRMNLLFAAFWKSPPSYRASHPSLASPPLSLCVDQAVHIEERDVQHGLQGSSSGGGFSCKEFSSKEVEETESQHNTRLGGRSITPPGRVGPCVPCYLLYIPYLSRYRTPRTRTVQCSTFAQQLSAPSHLTCSIQRQGRGCVG
jgi:hypothetical protein